MNSNCRGTLNPASLSRQNSISCSVVSEAPSLGTTNARIDSPHFSEGTPIAIQWPLMALGVWGVIPGPVEPIIVTVGGASLAGIFQYLMLRRHGIHASKWLILWIVGLVASLVPMAILFMSLDKLNMSISWPTEVFVMGFIVAGVAALISGKSLFATLSGPTQIANHP